jgi:mRNA-degrading endonuclease RelE of RelBE toxin-antitoxin system
MTDTVAVQGQERYRIRQGDYRIFYEIEDDVLRVMFERSRPSSLVPNP